MLHIRTSGNATLKRKVGTNSLKNKYLREGHSLEGLLEVMPPGHAMSAGSGSGMMGGMDEYGGGMTETHDAMPNTDTGFSMSESMNPLGRRQADEYSIGGRVSAWLRLQQRACNA